MSLVPLILDLYDGALNPVAAGTASLTPSVQLTDPGTGIAVESGPAVVFRPSSPTPLTWILPTDVSGWAPSGWGWIISFSGVPGSPAAFTFKISSTGYLRSFTATSASPAVFTASGSALTDGTAVALSGSSLPGGFPGNLAYYVVSASGDTFSLALTPGGGALASTSSGSGTAGVVQYLSSMSPQSDVTTMAAYAQVDAGDLDGGSSADPVVTGIQGIPVSSTPPSSGNVLTYNGTEYVPGAGGGAVASVFGRTGAVTAQSGDYGVAEVTGAAPLASPALTGTPTAPTATALTDSTQVATTAYADSAVAVETSRAEAAEALKLAKASNLFDLQSAATARSNLGLGAAALLGTPVPVIDTLAPWQFAPEAYGGAGDGKLVSDGAMSSSSNPTHLTCATSTPFTSTAVDGGKAVIVIGAGSGGAPLLTTISTVTDSGHAVLAAGASATVTASGVIFGTDSTAAIKAAMAAAVAYGQAGMQYAEVVFQPAMYVVAGAATIGGATLGNAIFPLPVITASAARKLTLVLKGLASDAAALMHWQQPAPQAAGAVVAVLRLDGTVDATYGPASVFGGPYHGYGGLTSVFTNLQPVADNLSLLVPFNSTFSGFDFYGCAEARVTSASVMPMAIVPSGGAWPQQANGSITNAPQFGLRMPDVNNNDRCEVGSFSAEGMCYGFMPSEHTTCDSVRVINCIIGIQAYASSNAPHGGSIRYASVEACGQAVGVYTTTAGSVKLQIDQLDFEGSTQYLLYDPDNIYIGEIRFRDAGTGYLSGYVDGGSQARLINLDQPSGPLASQPAVPSTGTAYTNYYYRDALVTVTGGTVSQVTIDSTATNVVSGVFPVPSGHSITLAYTSAPSWMWVLN